MRKGWKKQYSTMQIKMKQIKNFWEMEGFVIYLLPLILYVIIMFILALIPIKSSISVLSYNPSMYVLHAFEFFILAVLLFRIFDYIKLEHPYLFTLILVVLLGLLTETAQLLVSYRSFNPFDLLSDTIGGLFILLNKVV